MTGAEVLLLIESGDEAWWNGDRKGAASAWRAALNEDPSPEGRAAEAMARVRLLQVSGNLGPFWHEKLLNGALEACPIELDPCALAWADRELYLPAFTGADPANVAGILGGRTDAAAAQRLTIAADGTRPEDPGTWVLSLGLGGAPGSGVGVTTRFVHPDLGWRGHRLDASAAIDTLGGGAVSAALQTATRPSWQGSVAVSRTVAWWWEGDQARPYQLDLARTTLGVGVSRSAARFQMGASARVEGQGTEAAVTAGPYGALTVSGGAAAGRFTAEVASGSYTHVGIGVDFRVHAPVWGGTLAGRVGGVVVPTESPFYRLPAAGGATLLRGAPSGRWRDAALASAQAEYRHAVWGPLHAAVFVDSAQVEGWHVTGGAGLRIVLPPEPLNTTRVDVGFGEGGWGVVVALGEAF